jgi:hypothetical protein
MFDAAGRMGKKNPLSGRERGREQIAGNTTI